MYLSVNISNALNCLYIYQLFSRGRSWIYFKLPVQSVPITTKAVSLNPADGDMYSTHYYVMKFVSDL
jgi:hypothetical protein